MFLLAWSKSHSPKNIALFHFYSFFRITFEKNKRVNGPRDPGVHKRIPVSRASKAHALV